MADGPTILVVDDNPAILGIAKTLLEIAGYTVVTAGDGEDGLRCYESHRSRIVLLLTDVVMPKMGGLDLAERVLRMDSQVSVVLMSGDARRDHQSWEYLAKPFRPAELVDMVKRVLSREGRTPEAAAHNAH